MARERLPLRKIRGVDRFHYEGGRLNVKSPEEPYRRLFTEKDKLITPLLVGHYDWKIAPDG